MSCKSNIVTDSDIDKVCREYNSSKDKDAVARRWGYANKRSLAARLRTLGVGRSDSRVDNLSRCLKQKLAKKKPKSNSLVGTEIQNVCKCCKKKFTTIIVEEHRLPDAVIHIKQNYLCPLCRKKDWAT